MMIFGNDNGFTLVELLVAFSIGIMVIVGGIVAGNNFNANQKVETATSALEESVKLARNYAITSQKPTSYSLGNIDYIIFNLNADGNYSVYGGRNGLLPDSSHPFLSNKINTDDVSVSAAQVIFSIPEGKLLNINPNTNVSYSAAIGNSVAVVISSKEELTSGKKIVVDASGKVTRLVLADALPTATPIPATPTPTVIMIQPTPTGVIPCTPKFPLNCNGSWQLVNNVCTCVPISIY